MAVTLDTTPATETALFSDWVFELTITDIGTGNVEKRIGYKLIDVGTGNEIVGLSAIKVPENNTTVSLNFKRELAAYIDTPLFNASNGNNFIAGNWQSYQKIQVKLVYGDLVFDGDVVPCENIDNVNIDSPTITFFNSAKTGNGNMIGNPVMNTKAERLYWCKGFPDYLTVKGQLNLPFTARDIYGNFSPEGSQLNLNSETNNQILFDLFQFLDLPADETPAAVIQFNLNGGTTTYVLENCCCDSNIQAGVLFLDPLGGRNVMPFNCLQESSIDIQQTIACLEDYKVNFSENQFDSFSPDIAQKRRVANKASYQNFVLEVEQPSSYKNRIFFNNFYASKEHHLILRSDGTTYLIPVVLTSGGVTHVDEEDSVRLTANLRSSQPIPTQL